MITALSVTVGIALVVLWAWFVEAMRFAALCCVSLLAIVWVWIAEQYCDQSAPLLRSACHRDISQSQPWSLHQTKLGQENLAVSHRVYFSDQVLFVLTPFAQQQLEKKFHGFEDEDVNGDPQKNRNVLVIVYEIGGQEPLISFFSKSTRIPSRSCSAFHSDFTKKALAPAWRYLGHFLPKLPAGKRNAWQTHEPRDSDICQAANPRVPYFGDGRSSARIWAI